MKKLMWHHVDDHVPESMGHYLVCSSMDAIPRAAYFYAPSGDWFETSSPAVLCDIVKHVIHAVIHDDRFALEIGVTNTDAAAISGIIDEIIDDNLAINHPDLFLLSEERYVRHNVGDDVEYWCDMPKAPLWGNDEEAMAATQIGANEILAAIEPTIRRVLSGFNALDRCPPWAIEEHGQ